MEQYFDIRLTDDQLRAISSVGLAHMGDAVFEILVRGWLCAHGKATGKGLHQATIRLVCAESRRSWRFSSGGAMPRFTLCRPTPAVRSMPKPLHWRHCWAGCIYGGRKRGSMNCFVR